MRIGEFLELPKIMTFSKDEEITNEVLSDFIKQHQTELPRYKKLNDTYINNADIFSLANKDEYKPDIRLSVANAWYMINTFTGYFNGIPVKKVHPDEEVASSIELFESSNDIEDKEHELAKLACVYGRAYEGLYQNEDAETKIFYESPENMFIVYDDTVEQKRLFAVRYSIDKDNKIKGTIYKIDETIEFKSSNKENEFIYEEPVVNPFSELPIHEFYLNEERVGLFEPGKTLIDNFNKALSEKANDVDYFSDSYMKLFGFDLDEEGVKQIRDNRIINASGENSEKAVAEFMDKPDSDQATENLLNRLEDLIFKTCMVADISDENFGQSSGTALAYKLQGMSNLALSFQRKFESSLRERYKLFFSIETNFPVGQSDGWKQMEFIFNRNEPKNIKEEAETASLLMGVTSQETALSVLSKVPDVRAEIKRMNEEMKDRLDKEEFDLSGNKVKEVEEVEEDVQEV